MVAIHLHTNFLITDCGVWTMIATHSTRKFVTRYSEVAPTSYKFTKLLDKTIHNNNMVNYLWWTPEFTLTLISPQLSPLITHWSLKVTQETPEEWSPGRVNWQSPLSKDHTLNKTRILPVLVMLLRTEPLFCYPIQSEQGAFATTMLTCKAKRTLKK